MDKEISNIKISLFNKDERYTESANTFYSKINSLVENEIKLMAEKGYLIRDIETIAREVVENICIALRM